jgi:neurotransmitter:Na+ symporter, NSS family
MASGSKHWSSNLGFILATTGAAVGLGNLWRFSFLAGEHGGGAFVLIYIACVFLIGMPIMLAELILGRTGGGSAVHSINTLIARTGSNRGWALIGGLSIFVPFIGIAYYSVVGGWTVDYAVQGLAGHVARPDGAIAASQFDTMLANPWRLLLAHSIFMAGIMLVLIRGVQKGIESLSKILMPALFIMLTGLMIYALMNGDTARALDFLFSPDWSAVTGKTVIVAAGQAFFSLAIGVGIMITYGAYVPNTLSLGRSVAIIALVDTAVALMAGIVIFPLVFAQGLDPAGGPGLIFVTLPTAFGQMSGGMVVGAAFFVLLFFAAFTTGIGTLEPVVAWMEERRGVSRTMGTLLAGSAAWAVGITALLSFNIWKHITPFNAVPGFTGKSIFDTMDFAIASVLLPFNGLLIALFTGWVVARLIRGKTGLATHLETLWVWSLRIVIPVAIVLIAVWK